MNIEQLIGKTFDSVEQSGDELVFRSNSGKSYKFYHIQDCCESVQIEDVCGNLADLVGVPILQAEENSSDESLDGKPTSDESFTWTFYRFATIKGSVVVRWLGTSNGYYSESVDFTEI